MSNIAPEIAGKKVSPSGAMAPVLYRISDACALLSISKAHLYVLVARGELRLVKLGCRSLVPASEIARLVSGEAA